MQEIVVGQRFSRRVVSEEQAREPAGEPYKIELIGIKGGSSEELDDVMEVGGAELTIYDNLDAKSGERVWATCAAARTCRPPGSSRRSSSCAPPRRTVARQRKEPDAAARLRHRVGEPRRSRRLAFLEEAEKRDHRRLGSELDLFSFPDEIGSGLAVFHPKGGIIRREMEHYSRRRHDEAGYEFVNTPHLTKSALFETSGHLDWYAEGMYPPMDLDAEYDDDGQLKRPGRSTT